MNFIVINNRIINLDHVVEISFNKNELTIDKLGTRTKITELDLSIDQINMLWQQLKTISRIIFNKNDQGLIKKIENIPIISSAKSNLSAPPQDVIKRVENNENEEVIYETILKKKKQFTNISNIGSHMILQDFIDLCNSGAFIDYDGHGYYATKNKESKIIVKPSDIASGNITKNKKFTHVVWYNR